MSVLRLGFLMRGYAKTSHRHGEGDDSVGGETSVEFLRQFRKMAICIYRGSSRKPFNTTCSIELLSSQIYTTFYKYYCQNNIRTVRRRGKGEVLIRKSNVKAVSPSDSDKKQKDGRVRGCDRVTSCDS